jgi:hypothetical protein
MLLSATAKVSQKIKLLGVVFLQINELQAAVRVAPRAPYIYVDVIEKISGTCK